MKNVILYTTATCPYCRKALRLLDKKGVKYTNINVSSDRDKFDDIKKQTGWDSVPQIFIDGQFVGGCDDIHKLDSEGKLNGLLGL